MFGDDVVGSLSIRPRVAMGMPPLRCRNRVPRKRTVMVVGKHDNFVLKIEQTS